MLQRWTHCCDAPVRVAVVKQMETSLTLVLPVSLAKMDGGTVTRCNFAGDQMAGASWTDKIMANKAEAATSQASVGEGAGEEEWVRALLSFLVGLVLSGMFD